MKRFIFFLSAAILALACTKTPEPAPEPVVETTVVLDQQTLSLPVGGTQQLQVTVTPAGKTVTWTTSASAVATVDEKGNVQGVAPGQAVITAKADDVSAQCAVTVVGISIDNLSSDAAILHAAGGESTFSVTAGSAWKINCDVSWLRFAPVEGSAGTTEVRVLADENAKDSPRPAVITVVSGSEEASFSITQRPNIYTRRVVGNSSMTNGIQLTYDGTRWTRIYALLPVPKTNLYQDITDFSVTAGTVYDCPDGVNSFVAADLGAGEIPASGENVVTESFHATAYEVSANLDLITDIPPYDPESAPCKLYLGKEDGDLVDPENKDVVAVANELWNASFRDLLLYARKCYTWTAENMQYGNMNTGLHTITQLMRTRLGDCGNFASVFISLLRAKGIPARHVVMLDTQHHGYHVRAEFYIPTYGWIPADPNFFHDNPGGNYFGEFTGTYVVTSLGINNICKDPDGKDFAASLMQVYWLWWWFSSPGSGFDTQHVFSSFR